MQGCGAVVFAVMAAALAGLLAGFTPAFHEGGEGFCTGCHNLRSSQRDGVPGSEGGVGAVTGWMLHGMDPSSTCLSCHAETGTFYNVLSRDGSTYTPGGDFYWLRKTFSWTARGEYHESSGDSHGHNIVALEYGLQADRRRSSAPGGTYPAAQLGCTSCHDPHGKVTSAARDRRALTAPATDNTIAAPGTSSGNYRLLGGIGYQGGGPAAGITFVYPAPVAVAEAGDWTETDSRHPAYGAGMSEWCANCHTDFLMDGTGSNGLGHPAGEQTRLRQVMIANYNAYVKTGDLTGTQGSAYLALVPFELGTTDTAFLDPSSSAGPDPAGSANVMCLTCHRAHATAFPDLGRWDFTATFLANSHPQAGDAGATGSDARNSYYGRDILAEFGPYQRQLCNKCHALD